MNAVTKLVGLVQEEGLTGTLKRVLTSLRARILRWEDSQWEVKHQLETSEIVDYTGTAQEHPGFAYVAANRRWLHTIVWNLQHHIDLGSYDLSEFSFVDYGSGKGQVLLTVAEYPFKAIYGIEYVGELHKIADNNVKEFTRHNPGCPPIVLENKDAADYAIPDTPCVLFFHNPFDETVMKRVIDKVHAHFDEYALPIIIVYIQLRDEQPGDATNNLKLLQSSLPARQQKLIYRSHWDRFLMGSWIISINILSS